MGTALFGVGGKGWVMGKDVGMGAASWVLQEDGCCRRMGDADGWYVGLGAAEGWVLEENG